MADPHEVAFARGVVRDSFVVLRWAASEEGLDDEGAPVVSPGLRQFMAPAVEEVHDGAYSQALRILDGNDPDYPPERVSADLDSVGWSGAQRIFKEQTLKEAGRHEVMDAVEHGGPRPKRRIWQKFFRVLNVALESLSIIPGVEPIKELKDFAESVTAD
jgi:hypothetical protein